VHLLVPVTTLQDGNCVEPSGALGGGRPRLSPPPVPALEKMLAELCLALPLSLEALGEASLALCTSGASSGPSPLGPAARSYLGPT